MGNVDTIIDCGAHDGSDTGYYLSLGKKVVSVDASPRMCQLIRNSYEKYINSGFLKVINCAISGSQEPLTFYESTWSHWNSSHYKIANRLGCASKSYTVESKTLSLIIQEINDQPLYVKIDIEGNDYDAIVSLLDISKDLRPKYVSCETECVGEHEVISNDDALKTLKALADVGYSKFKLVDQSTLSPVTIKNYKSLTKQTFVYPFKEGSTGCFGEDIQTDWVGLDEAESILINYRSWFDKRKKTNFQFWCDWHASM